MNPEYDISIIISRLQNAGYVVLDYDAESLILEDPTCILRTLQNVMDYAWLFIGLLTGILVFGLAIALIRGAKNNVISNLRSLVLIMGALTATKPIMNAIYGRDLFGTDKVAIAGCGSITVPLDNVYDIMSQAKVNLSNFNEFIIDDSISDTPSVYSRNRRYSDDRTSASNYANNGELESHDAPDFDTEIDTEDLDDMPDTEPFDESPSDLPLELSVPPVGNVFIPTANSNPKAEESTPPVIQGNVFVPSKKTNKAEESETPTTSLIHGKVIIPGGGKNTRPSNNIALVLSSEDIANLPLVEAFLIEQDGGGLGYQKNPVTGKSEYVVYAKKTNGKYYKRIGGTTAWRCNNPGNIRDSQTLRNFGSLNRGTLRPNTGYSVFPDYETGHRALADWLQRHKNFTITDAIHTFAPYGDNNNPQAYTNKVASSVGVDKNTKLSNLNQKQFNKVMDAIKEVEKTVAGQEYEITEQEFNKEKEIIMKNKRNKVKG